MAFSPDSTKLAIAQSDNIVFIYKLGLEWADKKSICNKFAQSSPVTCLTWPLAHPNEVVFGLAEGKVKIGQLRSNKPATLYSTDSYVASCCSSPDGHAILSGHLDGSVYRFYFEDASGGPAQSKFVHHSCVPYSLSWGECIVAAGNDSRVVFYDMDGGVHRSFDYTNDTAVREFGCAAHNPSGEAVVLGNFDKYFVYGYNARSNLWEEVGTKDVPNLYSVTSLAWKSDGSRLVVGSLCGAVDMYDACIRRYRYRGKFEFTYVSLSQVIVKRLSSGTRIVLKSTFNCEITKINIFQDRFLVANTPETLLLGDLDSCKLSEVPWNGSGSEKFHFDYPRCCMVFNAGELTLVEYGRNEILGSCRTEVMSPHLISCRINERPAKPEAGAGGPGYDEDASLENKKIAYLLDIHTIRCLDLCTGITCATVNHDCKVDWLELNGRASLLLFRDKRRQLHLYDIASQSRSTLLHYCNYVQWVPDSDVVVAQNRGNLCVWYNIAAPDKVTIYQINGDVDEIERGSGKTEVIVDEGINTASYMLDESLISFGTALEDGDYPGAMDILDGLELTGETEAMWSQLKAVCLAQGNLRIAERCCSALGDVAQCRYLRRVNKIAAECEEKMGGDGTQHWVVRARMAMLSKDFKGAERIFIDQGQVEEAIEMYQMMHRWDEAIVVADSRNHPETEQMKRDYFEYLKDSGQEEAAAALKEREGDHLTAINLYLKGGYPAKAAQVVTRHNVTAGGPQLLERIATAMQNAGMHDKAGELFERMDQLQRALESYVKGHAFRRAVELCRRAFPSKVVDLEERWGDYLVSAKRVDAAINHFIEAGSNAKAIDAAIRSKQWSKAVQLVDNTMSNVEVARPYYLRIARHYADSNDLSSAERFFVKAEAPQEAVEMYTRADRWEDAHKVAIGYMSESEVGMLYVDQAQKKEALGKWKEAEKLYLAVNEPDLAINMYKKQRKYDQMIRLVTSYRKDLLKETHLHLAQQLEMEGNLREAENHYGEAGEWQSAVNMYRANDMWDEAIRVAKFHGGGAASKRVAYAWALSLGGEAGSKLLTKLGLIEQAIEYAVESGAFDHAFDLAKNCLKSKLPEVHLKHALFLEDEERFREAEEEFIKASKPKEAIDMYTHQQDWANAMRVAEQFDPSSISDVLVAQARGAAEAKDYSRAETLFLNAKKPEMALTVYQDAGMWADALRVAKKHCPHKLHSVNEGYQRAISGEGGTGSSDDVLAAARMWEETHDWNRAIDAYLNVNKDHIQDEDQLAAIWSKAVRCARDHETGRLVEVSTEVSSRLQGMGKHIAAGDILKEVESYRESIDAYIAGDAWNKARALAETQCPNFMEYIEKRYQAHLASEGDGGGLVEAGNVTAGLDIFAERGEWEKVFDICGRECPGEAGRYAVQYAESLLGQGAAGGSGDAERVAEAVHALARHGAPAQANLFATYKSVTRRVLELSSDECETVNMARLSQELKGVLYKLVSEASGAGYPDAILSELNQLLLIAHYTALVHTARENNLADTATKLCVSLLRFSGIVPSDKAFFVAGSACKEQGWLQLAFVLLNRYLDLAEAIEDGDNSMLDNSDFVGTDIPSPFDHPLPTKQYLDEEQREDAREWVLAVSMDQQVEQTLTTRSCTRCGDSVYEACLVCPGCELRSEACVVTGFPIPPSQAVECKSCGNKAAKDSWNKFLVKTGRCPWCNAAQKPVY